MSQPKRISKQWLRYLLLFLISCVSLKPCFSQEREPDKGSTFNTGYGTQGDKITSSSTRYGLALGMNIPDIAPMSLYLRPSTFLAVRLFVVPPLPFNIRVEMPEDRISAKNGIAVSHPPFTVNFDAVYGPQFGLEALLFPMGGRFYISAGLSYRKLSLEGGVATSLILEAEASGTSTETNSVFSIETTAYTSQYVLRSAFGFYWQLQGNYFIDFTLLGLTKPYKAHSHFAAKSAITNPRAPEQEISDTLEEFKALKDIEMKDKALVAMRPAEELILPVIGVSVGVYL